MHIQHMRPFIYYIHVNKNVNYTTQQRIVRMLFYQEWWYSNTPVAKIIFTWQIPLMPNQDLKTE